MRKSTVVFAAIGALLSIRADDTWTGTVDGNWQTGGNWLSATVPPSSQAAGNTITIGAVGSSNFSMNLGTGAPSSITGLILNGNAGSNVSLAGNSLTFGTGGIDMTGAGVDLTFNNIVNLNANGGVWTVPAGRILDFQDVNVVNANGTGATTAGAGTIRLSGAAGQDNGAMALTLGGTTTLELNKTVAGGARAIGGFLTINSGATALITNNSGDQIYQNADVTVNSGGFFNLNGRSEAFDGLSGAGTVQNTSATAVTLTVGDDTNGGNFTGSISQSSGVISLTKGEAGAGSSGNSTFILAPTAAGNLTYTGPTTINEGSLRVNANAHSAISTNSRYVLNGANLENDATLTSINIPLGTGTGQLAWGSVNGGFTANGAPLSVTLSGGAQLTWGQTAFVQNNASIALGGLSFGNGAFTATMTNPIDLGGSAGAANGTLRSIRGTGGGAGFEGAFSGVISGASAIRKEDIAAINLANTANTFEGGAFVQSGGLGFAARGSVNAAGTGGIEAYVVPSTLFASTGSSQNPSVSYSGPGAVTADFFAGIADHNFASTVSLNANGVAHNFSLAPAGLQNDLYLGVPAGNNYNPGTLTPANSTYRLGGGNGQLNLNSANILTGANALVVRDGGIVSATAAQNMTGAITINGGAFQLRSNSATLSGSADIVVNGLGTHGFLLTGNLINGFSGGSATIYDDIKAGALLLQEKNDATGAWAGSRAVVLNGGTVVGKLSAANDIIHIPTVTLNEGYNMIGAQPQGSGTGFVRVANLNRAEVGATVEFRSQFGTLGAAGDTGKLLPTNINGSPVANVNGIIGGWALASSGNSNNPRDFASWNGSTSVEAVVIPAGDQTTTTALTSIASPSTKNILVNSATAANNNVTSSLTVNSLTVERDMAMTAGQTLTLGSGGILFRGSNGTIGPSLWTGAVTSSYNSGLPSAPNELFAFVSNDGTLDARIRAPITDNGGTPVQLVKGGPGRLTIESNHSFTGGIVVNEGLFVADFRNGGIGTIDANEITVHSGGIFQTGLANSTPLSLANTINLDGGTLRNDNTQGPTGDNVTFTGTINVTSLPNTSAFIDTSNARNITLSPTATLTGSGNLSRINGTGTAGTLDIQTANTSGFTGNIVLTTGTTQVSGAGVLPNVDYFLSGGTLGVTTTSGSTIRSLAGIGGTISGTAGGTDRLTVNQTIDTAYHGLVINTELAKSGTGHLNLTGAADNTAAAASVSNGILTLGKASNRDVHAAGLAAANAVSITGGTLRLGGNYTVAGTAGNAPAIYLTANGTPVNPETQANYVDQIHKNSGVTLTAGTMDLNGRSEAIDGLAGSGGQVRNDGAVESTLYVGQNGGSASYSGALNDGTGTLGLVKVGAGTQTLSGTGTYTGKTILTGGSLQITSGNEATLGANPATPTFDQLTLSGGTLQVSTADLTINDANRGIAISSNSGTFNVDGGRVLSVSNALAGAPGILNKAGAGTFNMTGNASVASFVTAAGIYNQNAGTTTVGTAGGANVSSGATYSLAGGVLRTDVVNVTAGGTFNWGAELTMRQSQAGVTPSGVDFSTGPLPGAPVVKTGTVIQGSGALTGGNNAVLNLDGLYVSGGIMVDRMEVAGSVSLGGVGDRLEWNNSTVYLLRPFGFFTEDYGSIPLLAATSITGTFDTYSGLSDDGKGYTQLATVVGGPLVNPASLNTNEGVLQYAYGVVNPAGFAAGTYDLIYFHYKVQGAVPEPDTFALLALSVVGLRTARVLRDRRARLG